MQQMGFRKQGAVSKKLAGRFSCWVCKLARCQFHYSHKCFMALSLTSCRALLLVIAGGFKVNQLPASPFEGARHPSTTSASINNNAPSNGPFGSRLANVSHSMDTTNSNSGGPQSSNQGDRERDRDHPAAFRGLPSASSQKETDRSPEGRESPFESLRQQQQQQVSSRHPMMPTLTCARCLYYCYHDCS